MFGYNFMYLNSHSLALNMMPGATFVTLSKPIYAEVNLQYFDRNFYLRVIESKSRFEWDIRGAAIW